MFRKAGVRLPVAVFGCPCYAHKEPAQTETGTGKDKPVSHPGTAENPSAAVPNGIRYESVHLEKACNKGVNSDMYRKRLAWTLAVLGLLAGGCGAPAGLAQPSPAPRPVAKMPTPKRLSHPLLGPMPPAAYTPAQGQVVYQNEVVVLMYHAIRPVATGGDVITPATFAEELKRFRQDGYHVISLRHLIRFMQDRQTVPPNAIVITFDNGYRSFYREALPLLQAYHDPAALFPIVGWLNGEPVPAGNHALTWKEMRAIQASGLVDIQSQTYNLHQAVAVGPHTTEAADIGRVYSYQTGQQESPAAYVQSVTADLLQARQVLQQKLGLTRLDAFVYPFGDYTPALIHILHQTGYRYLFTAKIGWANQQGGSLDTIYRINAGAWDMTPQGLIFAINQVARLTAANPHWQPPARFVEKWRS